MAAILLGQATPLSKLDPDDRSVLTALTDLRPAKLEAENLRISQLLEESFSDPTLHEMAAVILGAFGLRDFSGDFHDVRLTMCRMTAHLAMARTLSGNTVGLNGQMAEVMLATLMNNQTVALDNLKALAKDAGLQPWVRALRARNTMDYRELKSVENPTLLEMTSCYWASSKCLGSSSGWDEFPAQAVRTFADFSRLSQPDPRTLFPGWRQTGSYRRARSVGGFSAAAPLSLAATRTRNAPTQVGDPRGGERFS